MATVEPIFTLETLQHEVLLLFNAFLVMRLFAMAVNVKETHAILILLVFIVFIIVHLAALWHVRVATVTSER